MDIRGDDNHRRGRRVPLALLLARGHGWTAGVLPAFRRLPLVLPPVVSGVALLALLGRTGLIGSRIDTWFGFTIPFTQSRRCGCATFVALPFLVITVEGALRTKGRHLEQAARTLGASESRIMWSVTIRRYEPRSSPVRRCAGRGRSGIRRDGNVRGELSGGRRALPIEVYYSLVTQPDRAIAMKRVDDPICVVVLVSLRRSWSGRFLCDTQ